MKLDRLLIFLRALSQNKEIISRAVTTSLFYFFDGKWWDSDKKVIADTALANRLERTADAGHNWRAKGSKVT